MLCQECVDGSWGVHRCTAPGDCECKSDECLEAVWVGSPRWKVAGPKPKPKPHEETCWCDGPAHPWAWGWCPKVGPVKRR